LRHWTLWAWFALAVFLSVGGLGLWRSGRWLIREDGFAHVEWALVLAGESRDCERTDAAIRLLQEGRIDTMVLSATRVFKNRYQSEFMLDYAIQQGVPRDRVFEFRQDTYSTQEEARLLIRQFRLQNLDTVLVVTSNYHTARARRIFRKLAQGFPVVLVASADYPLFDPNAWWSNRESRKIWFSEWMKTFFTAYELWRARPESGQAEYQGLLPDPSGQSGTPLPTPDSPVRGSGDTASARGVGENAMGGDGSEPNGQEGASDSLKSGNPPSGAAADSAKDSKDSAGTAEGKAREEAKGSETKLAKVTKDSTTAEAKSAGEAEAKKAPAHPAAKKQTSAPAKPLPKREEKKAEKPKKKG
jgi:uncharacterized SAM-binding protein YcdF (DUF218 family)